ncbi:MAG TPA: hypothetical protein VE378_04745 [Nitrososphaeraceae archaeon]|jgi:hypothetical protein|nr:hypothetical protein [Nitrososphaeraceae archaeon]
MSRRKPVLIIDDSDDSLKAIDLLMLAGIDYVEYDIKKFEDSCCGDLPTANAPSLFVIEGIFKGLEKINEYISNRSDTNPDLESESAYW